MASALGTASTAPSAAATAKSSAHLPLSSHRSHSLSFRVSSKPKLRISTKGLSSWNRTALVRAQSNEVAVDGSSTTAVNAPSKSSEVKDLKLSNGSAQVATEESITQFMGQVAGLVKLVDSNDVVELQLKQLNCELVIRKKEALPPPPSPTPYMMAPSHYAPPPAPVAAAPAPAPAPALAAVPAAAPVAKSPPKSSVPPLKSPMAGTFYRSPGPGEPPFVKVGDKVQKGQVLCIIEAMKLMNEIEADQSGTVIDVVAEDGKPVSFDSPLFVIQP